MSQDENLDCGSTLVVFDLNLDGDSNQALALNPTSLDAEIAGVIAQAHMKRRNGMLDCWNSTSEGPATSFHSIEESHVRLSSFARAETWTKADKKGRTMVYHVNGEAQLCNYSRINRFATQQLVRDIVRALNPATANFLYVRRGPGPEFFTEGSLRYKRGDELPPFKAEVEAFEKAGSLKSKVAA